MVDGRRELGSRGEELAAAFFAARGYDIVERNWRCDIGEIDLIVRKGKELRCIEVKTRRSFGGGLPEESVTEAKLTTLADLLDRYVEAMGGVDPFPHLDVLSIYIRDGIEYAYFPDIDAS